MTRETVMDHWNMWGSQLEALAHEPMCMVIARPVPDRLPAIFSTDSGGFKGASALFSCASDEEPQAMSP